MGPSGGSVDARPGSVDARLGGLVSRPGLHRDAKFELQHKKMDARFKCAELTPAPGGRLLFVRPFVRHKIRYGKSRALCTRFCGARSRRAYVNRFCD